MSKGRSPNYPQLTLREAMEKGRLIYKQEHRHPASREVVAKDMGYKSLNGASLTVIAALRHYNIIADSGAGVAISDDAFDIFELPVGERQRNIAICRCAFAPGLFTDIRNEFGDELPSEANLRHGLIKKGFLPKAAEGVIRIYRENLELVKDALADYDGVSKLGMEGENNAMQEQARQQPPPNPPGQTSALYSWPLAQGVKAEIRLTGPKITASHLEMLRQYLELAKAALEADPECQ